MLDPFQHSVPHTPEDLPSPFQVLPLDGIVAFALFCGARHPLMPFGISVTTRQDSLDVADCWIVPFLKEGL